jgi:putative SOS response-associated peptidase YedK
MCGRYVLEPALTALRRHFDLPFDTLEPRYNVAPKQRIPVIRRRDEGGYELVELQWGLIPFWAKDRAMQYNTINAKVERVQSAPSYREPFKKRRCLIPASGFYEWQPAGARKQPWYISAADGEGLAFAGLWDRWHDRESDEAIESCTIIVGPANELMSNIHDRQPCIIPPEHYHDWLDPEAPAPFLLSLLQAFPPERLCAWPVSPAVGNVRNQGAGLIAPLEDAGIELGEWFDRREEPAPAGRQPRTAR